MSDTLFHPAVEAWFRTGFEAPSPVQAAAWPAIARGGHTLLAAPTGSGKTLAAFLAVIDGLLREGLERGPPRPDAGALCVAPEGLVHRHPAQSAMATVGHR